MAKVFPFSIFSTQTFSIQNIPKNENERNFNPEKDKNIIFNNCFQCCRVRVGIMEGWAIRWKQQEQIIQIKNDEENTHSFGIATREVHYIKPLHIPCVSLRLPSPSKYVDMRCRSSIHHFIFCYCWVSLPLHPSSSSSGFISLFEIDPYLHEIWIILL